MQFEALKVFCDIARQRSFSQAAAVNDLTQSAASQIVLQLEKRLGVQLIDRSTRPLQLTAAGQRYYEGCKRLVEEYGDLELSVRQAQSDLESTVQVAAIYSVGLGDMGQLVERFQAEHPGVRVQVEYLHPDRVYEKVLDGSVDFGLVSFPRKLRELTIRPWRDEPMVVVSAPNHPLAGQRSIRLKQLDGAKFVGFDKELVIRREVDRFLREQDVAVQVVMEFDNIENIKKALEVSPTVALLPEPTLRQEVEAGTLVAMPLAGLKFVRPLGILQRRQGQLSRNAEQFMTLLTEASPASPSAPNHGRRRPAASDNGALRNGSIRHRRDAASPGKRRV
jgi:DNA-binding transcriptional LysR family regulator